MVYSALNSILYSTIHSLNKPLRGKKKGNENDIHRTALIDLNYNAVLSRHALQSMKMLQSIFVSTGLHIHYHNNIYVLPVAHL